MAETTQDNHEKLEFLPLPPTREDLGYTWSEHSIHESMESLGKFLTRNKARAYMQDVYASNSSVYRNLLIQLPRLSRLQLAQNIHITFDRDDGRELLFSRE